MIVPIEIYSHNNEDFPKIERLKNYEKALRSSRKSFLSSMRNVSNSIDSLQCAAEELCSAYHNLSYWFEFAREEYDDYRYTRRVYDLNIREETDEQN